MKKIQVSEISMLPRASSPQEQNKGLKFLLSTFSKMLSTSGDFELNPKEIRLIPLLLPVADKREHEKEHACLPRSLHRLGLRLKDELP